MIALSVGCSDKLSEFLLYFLADSMHITEILLSR